MREKLYQQKRQIQFIHYGQLALLFAYIIAIGICLLCDIIINQTLSWSLLVLVSITIAYCCTHLSIKFKRNKLIKTVALINFLIYLLLLTIKYAVYPSLNLYISFLIATIIFTTIWITIGIVIFIKNKVLKASLALIVIGLFVAYINPVINYLLTDSFEMQYNLNLNFFIGIGFTVIGFTLLIKKCLTSMFSLIRTKLNKDI